MQYYFQGCKPKSAYKRGSQQKLLLMPQIQERKCRGITPKALRKVKQGINHLAPNLERNHYNMTPQSNIMKLRQSRCKVSKINIFKGVKNKIRQITQTGHDQNIRIQTEQKQCRGPPKLALAKLIRTKEIQTLKTINLEGNAIGDAGVQILCRQQFKNLEVINLNDNGITIQGVATLINNTWNKVVTYKLETAITTDGGYALEVGENIKNIKNIINSSKNIDSRVIDQLQQKNQKQLYKSIHLLMETPLQGKLEQIVTQSKLCQKKLKKIAKIKPISAERALITLQQSLGHQKVTFSQKSNVRSQLSLKILSCGMGKQNIMIEHRIVDKNWNFMDFKNNSALLMQFQKWYKQKLAWEYGADMQDITVHKITEGSIKVLVSVGAQNPLLDNQKFPKNEQLQLHPFFAAFNLSIDDFDKDQDFEFPNNDQCDNQWRGGIPYLQPIHAKRFGINVLNLYDQGDNNWISMDGVTGEYSVGFHGVNQPAKIVPPKNKTILESIMVGRKSGEMLKGGPRQLYQDTKTVNKQSEKVGNGVYLSPYFTTALAYTYQCNKLPKQPYRVIFQVRFRPEALKCTENEEYWVVNKSKDVRPYGIILFTPQQYQYFMKRGKQIYSRSMSWNSWKNEYIKFRNKHKLPI